MKMAYCCNVLRHSLLWCRAKSELLHDSCLFIEGPWAASHLNANATFGDKAKEILSSQVMLALDSNHDDLLLRCSQFIITSEILYKGQTQSSPMSMSFVPSFKCSVLLADLCVPD